MGRASFKRGWACATQRIAKNIFYEHIATESGHHRRPGAGPDRGLQHLDLAPQRAQARRAARARAHCRARAAPGAGVRYRCSRARGWRSLSRPGPRPRARQPHGGCRRCHGAARAALAARAPSGAGPADRHHRHAAARAIGVGRRRTGGAAAHAPRGQQALCHRGFQRGDAAVGDPRARPALPKLSGRRAVGQPHGRAQRDRVFGVCGQGPGVCRRHQCGARFSRHAAGSGPRPRTRSVRQRPRCATVFHAARPPCGLEPRLRAAKCRARGLCGGRHARQAGAARQCPGPAARVDAGLRHAGRVGRRPRPVRHPRHHPEPGCRPGAPQRATLCPPARGGRRPVRGHGRRAVRPKRHPAARHGHGPDCRRSGTAL